ncbi:MAG: GntR family transcriptional regulator [Gemmatimonadota bacterium]
MLIRLEQTDGRPLYVQIMDAVRAQLVRGALGAGDALPSVRELASSLRINPRTVSQAYAELEREGIVHVRPGKGSFIDSDVQPTEVERPRLAREVALRTMADASRNGLLLDDVLDALRILAREADSKKEGVG